MTELDPNKPVAFRGVALELHATSAAKVGIILNLFTAFEDLVPALLSKLSGISEDHAQIICGSFVSISHRVDLLEKVPNSNQGAIPEGLDLVIEFLREANRLRNVYAHAQYGIRQDDGIVSVSMETFKHSSQRQSRKISKTVADMDRDIFRLKFYWNEIENFLWLDVLPVPFSDTMMTPCRDWQAR